MIDLYYWKFYLASSCLVENIRLWIGKKKSQLDSGNLPCGHSNTLTYFQKMSPSKASGLSQIFENFVKSLVLRWGQLIVN